MWVINALARVGRSAIRSSTFSLVSLVVLLLPAELAAQPIQVTVNGNISVTSSQLYFGKYVAHATDYGFLWLDTSTLTAGYLPVFGKCGTGVPTPVTQLYAVSDCNGIGSLGITPDGKTIVANNLNRQCWVTQKQCGGPRVNDVEAFAFQVGTWTYIPTWNTQEPGNSQTTDPQGRTWSVSCTPPGSSSVCTWTGSGNPLAPPTNNATATNQSASGRTDKTNYFGDSWTLQDTSQSIPPITQVAWDYRYTGSFTPDLPLDTAGGQFHSFPFPCDPAGNPAGSFGPPAANCWQSVGSPTTTGTYSFALQATNSNGVAAPFVSSPISVSPPQVSVAGFDGTTLHILTNGSADASASQGNTGNAVFNWTFSPGGAPSCTQPCKVVPVPGSATSFTLQVAYPGGFTTPVLSGGITQVDLVAGFTLAPNPVLLNSSLTLTNKMQKSTNPSVILNSVDHAIVPGVCGAQPPAAWDGTFNNSSPFLAANGTATVAAPTTVGSFCAWVRFNYNDHNGSPAADVASNPFSATNWAPNPQLLISPPPLCLSSCQLTTGTAYSLSDSETMQVSPHPGATWILVNGANQTTVGTSADASVPVSWTPTAVCNSGCSLKVTVGTVTSSPLPITISNPGPPPPPNTPTVNISGPSSLSIGQSGTFTANVSNASGSVTYQWLFDGDAFPTSGGASMAHSWAGNGSHVASVTVNASNGSASATHPVNVTGNPLPGGGLSITPSQVSGSTYTVGRGQALTFTATEVNAAQWGWTFGDGTFAGGATSRSVPKAYSTYGTYNAQLLVYADNVHNSGLAVTNFTVVVGAPLPSPAFNVSGATQNPTNGSWDTEVGRALTFTATEPNAVSFGWDFGDGTTSSGRTVNKSYTVTGTKTVRLTVTGDGVNNAGTTSGTAVMNLNPSSFHAAIVPGVAHLDDGTTTWGTDFSATNVGAGPMTLNLAFLPLLPDSVAPSTLDLTQISYGSPIQLGAGGTYSIADVVTALNGGNNKGTLVLKYTGVAQAPLVSTRVYFAPKVNPSNISYGSGLPAYQVDSTGRISAQGFNAIALDGATPAGSASESIQATQDFSVTVNMAGTGTGTVTSTPAGISCPGTCTASFSAAPVFLNGSAASGSTFVSITGCDSYPLGACTINGAKTVTATFNSSGPPPPPPPPAGNFNLTVGKGGSGTGSVTSSPAGINCGSTCSAAYAAGTIVTLTPSADSGSSFVGWGGSCSGSGACAVTMSAAQSVTATFNAQVSQAQGDQVLIGLRADPRYRFGVTLFNASNSTGTFRLSAMDDQSAPVLIADGKGGQVAYRDFTIRPYQQTYLKNDDLGLNDPNARYVLKSTRTSSNGTLLAFGTALDRQTNDLVEVTDDSQASPADAGIVSYWVAGVSHYDSSYGAHWRTDLRIYNRGSHSRNLYFEYTFSGDGKTEHLAHANQISLAAGQLLTYDDVISFLATKDSTVDLSGSSAGVLRIYYPEDSESASRPLIIGSRNYDDEPTGTAGSQLAVYTNAQSANAGGRLVLSGAEESANYSSRIGVFTLDPGQVSFRIVAVAPDGTEVGSLTTALGGAGLHYGQISLTNLSGFANPNTPVSVRIDSITGGRVAAYAFTVDKVTLDTNFIQAFPQQ